MGALTKEKFNKFGKSRDQIVIEIHETDSLTTAETSEDDQHSFDVSEDAITSSERLHECPKATIWAKAKEITRLRYTRAKVEIKDLKTNTSSISKVQQFSRYYVEPLISQNGKNDRALVGPCLAKVDVQDRNCNNQNVIHAASHNYAGFYRSTPESEQIQRRCLDTLPTTGTSAVPSLEAALHQKIAALFDADFCYSTSTGYASNLLAFPAILDSSWTVILDEKCHSSMLSGAYLSDAHIRKFKHNDMVQLSSMLEEHSSGKTCSKVLVAVEGLYSMDGTVPPLDKLAFLKNTYGLVLLADEAHSMQSLGRTGRGCVEMWNDDHPESILGLDLFDIRTATLSKACGAIGGIVCGNARFEKSVKTRHAQLLANGAEPISAVVMAQTLHVLGRPTQLERNLRRMRSMVSFVREELKRFGLYVYGDALTPVLPIYTGRPSLAAKLSYTLRQLGLLATPIGPPAVPWWEARVRICLSVDFDDDTVNKLVSIILDAAERLQLIPKQKRKQRTFCSIQEESTVQEELEADASQKYINSLIHSDQDFNLNGERLATDVIEAGHSARQRYGLASGAARWVTGTYDIHLQAERQTADLSGTQDAMTYVDQYLGLMSTVAALSRPVIGYKKHYLLVPENAPAAVVAGIRVAPRKEAATVLTYGNPLSLSEIFNQSRKHGNHMTIYIDSDMQKHTQELEKAISSEARSADPHGLTILLNSGVSPHEVPHLDLVKVVRSKGAELLIFGSYSRHLGLSGAYLAGSTLLLNELRYTSRGYMFSTSQLPYVMGMISAALSKLS